MNCGINGHVMRFNGTLASWNDERGFGWPGALVAQQLLRHKTAKAEFISKFWATVTLNLAGLVALTLL